MINVKEASAWVDLHTNNVEPLPFFDPTEHKLGNLLPSKNISKIISFLPNGVKEFDVILKPDVPDDDLSNVNFEFDTVFESLIEFELNVPISATKPLSHVANMDVYTGAGVVVVVVVVVGTGVVVVVVVVVGTGVVVVVVVVVGTGVVVVVVVVVGTGVVFIVTGKQIGRAHV